MKRRPLLLAGLAPAIIPVPLPAQQRASLKDPLRLGVDLALAESGFAAALQRSFGRDTGIAVQLVAAPALPLLASLERGELDASLTNTPEAELKLADQGLAHDRRMVARASYVIVGPAPRPKPREPAAIAGTRDAAQALQAIQTTAQAAPDALRFLTAGDGSGTHWFEQTLWRAARVAPTGDWYVTATPEQPLAAQARKMPAYAVVERGAWAAQGGAPLAVLVEGDALLEASVHYMRSFHLNHPAAKIFADWITGRRGARVVASLRGYRAPGR